METKRFYRSRTNKVLAGVCGGLAEYFNIDPLVVRLLFLALIVIAGGGLLAYIILWIITPEKPIDLTGFQNPPANNTRESSNEEPRVTQEPMKEDPFRYPPRKHKERGNLIGGLVLITLGILFLADEFIPHVSFSDLWPIILVVIGAGLLINSTRGRKNNM